MERIATFPERVITLIMGNIGMKFKEFFNKRAARITTMRDDLNYKNYNIGEWTYGSPKVLAWDDKTQLTIGKYCSIADGVTFLLGGEHRSNWISTYPFNKLFEEGQSIEGHPATKGDIVIGNDVWVGHNATILSGVTIGSGAIIGACAVVSKNVEPYTIVAGNPAKKIRARFDDASITLLLNTCWWDLPHEHVLKLIPLLLSADVKAFINAVNELGQQA